MNYHIEPARTSDFLDVAALDRVAWGGPNDTFIPDGEHVWRVWCEYATVLVARGSESDSTTDSDGLAGALVMFPTTDGRNFLHKVMVDPRSRGQGIGTELMEAALAQAEAPVLLTVDPENQRAVRLYEKFGFEISKTVQGYYRPQEDRLLMVYRRENNS